MLYAYPFDPLDRTVTRACLPAHAVVAIEALRSGVTCLLDDCIELPKQDLEQLGAMFRAYEDAGIPRQLLRPRDQQAVSRHPALCARLPAGRVVRSVFRAAPPPTTEWYLEFATEAVRRFHGRAGRLRYVIAPSGPQRCTDDLLAAAAEFADRHDTAYHMHVLETKVQMVTGTSCTARAWSRTYTSRGPQPTADDGARDLDHRRRHRADVSRRLLGRAQSGLQSADRRRHRPAAQASRRGHQCRARN